MFFSADLTGSPRPGRRRRRLPPPKRIAEQERHTDRRPAAPSPNWRSVISTLTRGEADVGRPHRHDAGGNALLVAARIFCDRNALSPRAWRSADVRGLRCDHRRCARYGRWPRVTARGPIVNSTQRYRAARVLQVMRLLATHLRLLDQRRRGPGRQLHERIGRAPLRVEGSAVRPRCARRTLPVVVTDFTAADSHEPQRGDTGIGPRLGWRGPRRRWTITERRGECSRTPSEGCNSVRDVVSTSTRRSTMRRQSSARTGFAPLRRVLDPRHGDRRTPAGTQWRFNTKTPQHRASADCVIAGDPIPSACRFFGSAAPPAAGHLDFLPRPDSSRFLPHDPLALRTRLFGEGGRESGRNQIVSDVGADEDHSRRGQCGYHGPDHRLR